MSVNISGPEKSTSPRSASKKKKFKRPSDRHKSSQRNRVSNRSELLDVALQEEFAPHLEDNNDMKSDSGQEEDIVIDWSDNDGSDNEDVVFDLNDPQFNMTPVRKSNDEDYSEASFDGSYDDDFDSSAPAVQNAPAAVVQEPPQTEMIAPAEDNEDLTPVTYRIVTSNDRATLPQLEVMGIDDHDIVDRHRFLNYLNSEESFIFQQIPETMIVSSEQVDTVLIVHGGLDKVITLCTKLDQIKVSVPSFAMLDTFLVQAEHLPEKPEPEPQPDKDTPQTARQETKSPTNKSKPKPVSEAAEGKSEPTEEEPEPEEEPEEEEVCAPRVVRRVKPKPQWMVDEDSAYARQGETTRVLMQRRKMYAERNRQRVHENTRREQLRKTREEAEKNKKKKKKRKKKVDGDSRTITAIRAFLADQWLQKQETPSDNKEKKKKDETLLDKKEVDHVRIYSSSKQAVSAKSPVKRSKSPSKRPKSAAVKRKSTKQRRPATAKTRNSGHGKKKFNLSTGSPYSKMPFKMTYEQKYKRATRERPSHITESEEEMSEKFERRSYNRMVAELKNQSPRKQVSPRKSRPAKQPAQDLHKRRTRPIRPQSAAPIRRGPTVYRPSSAQAVPSTNAKPNEEKQHIVTPVPARHDDDPIDWKTSLVSTVGIVVEGIPLNDVLARFGILLPVEQPDAEIDFTPTLTRTTLPKSEVRPAYEIIKLMQTALQFPPGEQFRLRFLAERYSQLTVEDNKTVFHILVALAVLLCRLHVAAKAIDAFEVHRIGAKVRASVTTQTKAKVMSCIGAIRESTPWIKPEQGFVFGKIDYFALCTEE